ncbi:hypothetical protein BKA56DRAFT_707967 [Ilyonectria sp. MPI-CAGE-AT-0026]|nr:hypothetical protein BKA56DRAFT_707967 [Ilyonectria sp. MPI-CAGE-AT-0026]
MWSGIHRSPGILEIETLLQIIEDVLAFLKRLGGDSYSPDTTPEEAANKPPNLHSGRLIYHSVTLSIFIVSSSRFNHSVPGLSCPGVRSTQEVINGQTFSVLMP